MGRAAPCLFSIGHSTHDFAIFVKLLQSAGVTAIADVRSHPFSRWHPQFNQKSLEAGLQSCQIVYAFLGDQLGGRPGSLDLYDADGRVNYERVRGTETFRHGIDRLCQAVVHYEVAMLCSEEDPLVCHRGLMVSPAMVKRGIAPIHLRGDGSVETSPEFEDRLIRETKVAKRLQDGLFATALPEEEKCGRLLAEAYRVQARRKGFRMPTHKESPEQVYDRDESVWK